MTKYYYSIFKTSFGYGALIFHKNKIYEFILPLKNKKEIYKIIKNKKNIIPVKFKSDWLNNLINKIKNYFKGKKIDFQKYKIDLSMYTQKEKLVLNKLRKIKYGQLITYKELARLCKIPNGARFIGNVMAKNKTPLIIPCHRVIKSNNLIGNFSYGKNYKLRLLRIENSLNKL